MFIQEYVNSRRISVDDAVALHWHVVALAAEKRGLIQGYIADLNKYFAMAFTRNRELTREFLDGLDN